MNQEKTSYQSLFKCDDDNIVIYGKLLKIAEVKDEWYAGNTIPQRIVDNIQNSRLNVDIFTFMQKPPDIEPRYEYYMEWDNVAAICLESFEHWWNKQIPKQTRNHVRRAEKSGIVVKVARFDDEMVQGISKIYNESPIRQGKPFKHYKKDIETIRRIHATYLEKSDFIGAYLDGELIGFIKLVYTGKTARTMQIISILSQRNKAPNNALLAKAVEICCEKGVHYLVYGRYSYGNVGSKSLALFKKENGFTKILLPRYYIPTSIKGNIFLKLKLHRGISSMLSDNVIELFIYLRNKWYLMK